MASVTPLSEPSETAGGKNIYDNPRRLGQLSEAARSSLARKYGAKNTPPVRSSALTAPQAADLAGTITNVLVNDPTTDTTKYDTQSETTLVLGAGRNVIVAFNDSGSYLPGVILSNHFTGYAVSTNGGGSFCDKGRLPDDPEGDAGDPVLARGLAAGLNPETIYLATLGETTGEKIQLFRSFDNGLTFTAPVNATPGFIDSGDFEDKPWIAVDNYAGNGQGNVYLAWRHYSNGSFGTIVPYGIRFTRSTNGGTSWGPNQGLLIAPEDANEVQGAYVTIGPDHAVYVFWLDQSAGEGTPNIIKMRKSTDQGVSFGTAVTVAILNNANEDGDLDLGFFRSDAFPQAAVNPVNGNVYVVYNDSRMADRGDIYFRQSTDGGATWGGATRVNDDATMSAQFTPVLAVTPNGLHLFVSFYDRRLDIYDRLIDTFGAIADISGASVVFRPNFRITSQSFPAVFNQDPNVFGNYMGDYDTAVADNTGFYYSWGDNRGSNSFHLHDPDVRFAKVGMIDFTLNVPLSATEGDGVLSGVGLVSVPTPAAADVVVTFAVDDLSVISVPPSVTIPAGQTSATFDITIIDDTKLDGTQSATIIGNASGFVTRTATMVVYDDETAALQVALPAMVSEGAGATQGVVFVSAPVAANISVDLSSSDTTRLQVPGTIVIPNGLTSAAFSVTMIDNNLLEPPRSITVTAHVQNWTSGSATITVLDNEPRTLTETLPSTASEAAGVLIGAGSVSLAGLLPTNLVINLVSSDSTSLVVPATVTIPAGVLSASFDLTLLDNPLVDGNRDVTVTASASEFINGAGTVRVLDDESPPPPSDPSPANLATNIPQTNGLAWQSGAMQGQIITNDVYLAMNATLTAGALLGTTTNDFWILPPLAPLTTYYWQVVAHRGGITPGPVWQFTTRGVDHFAWGPVSSPQTVNLPFPATVTAQDAYGNTVSNFTGILELRGSVNTLNQALSISLTPTHSGNFSNGLWAGMITLLQPATDLYLLATDTSGHSGTSNPFDAVLQNDLAVSIVAVPSPAVVGNNLTNRIRVMNSGPDAATACTLTNLLPVGVAYISATASQGGCASHAGVVVCDLGTLAAGASATVNVLTVPGTAGVMTNRVWAGRGESDGYDANNAASSVTTVLMPTLGIRDVAIAEGNSGVTNARFEVFLQPPTMQTVTVAYATSDGTAVAGSDYAATNGLLQFLPGQTNQFIIVLVNGDTNIEQNECFSVNLSGPVNAVLGNTQGLGTVLNDDTSARVAVLGAVPAASWNEDVRQKIASAGNFQQVDSILVSQGYPVPTLAQLQPYAAVLVYGGDYFNDPVALGNMLADYVDAGGGLVVATSALENAGDLGIHGRILSGGYLPFQVGAEDGNDGELSLVADIPTHPILLGVASFSGGTASVHNIVTLTDGALQLAHWNNNVPLVGIKNAIRGRVAGLNLYPPSESVEPWFWRTNTSGGLLLANALDWAAQSGCNTTPMNPLVILSQNLGFTNGQFAFSFSNSPGQAVIIETSPNLQSWIPLQTNTLGAPSLLFIDPQLTTVTNRFYRLRAR